MNYLSNFVHKLKLKYNFKMSLLIIGSWPQTERYNLARDEWEPLKSTMKTARYDHGAAVLNGKIYVCGGSDDKRHLDSVEVYDPKTDRYHNCQNIFHFFIFSFL